MCKRKKEDLPQENVDLLIDNIKGQDTESIVVNNIPGGTIFVKGALGHFGKYLGHGIHSFIRILLSESQDLTSISCEFIAQKHIHEENLTHDIDKIEKLTEEEPEGIEIMILDIGNEVVENEFLSARLIVLVHDGTVEVHDQHFNFTPFPCFPEISRNIEEHGLEEENEADPLVVLVVLHFVRFTRHT